TRGGHGSWLLVDDGSPLGDQLAARLAVGAAVTRATPGEPIEAALSSLHAGVVWLAGEGPSASDDDAIGLGSLGDLTQLLRTLAALPEGRPRRTAIVTRRCLQV